MSVRENVRDLRPWLLGLAVAAASCAPEAERKVELPLPLLQVTPARPMRTPPSAPKALRGQVADLLDPLREAGVTRELAVQIEGILVRTPDASLGAVWPYLLDGNEGLALFAAEYYDRRGRLADVPRVARLSYLISRTENQVMFFDGPPPAELPHVREMKLLSRFDAGAIRHLVAARLRAPDEKLRLEFSAVLASLTGESLPTTEAWRAWVLGRFLVLTEAEAGFDGIDRSEVARRLKGRLQACPTDLPALVGYALTSPADAGRFMLRMGAESARKERAYALAFVPSHLAVPLLSGMALAREKKVRLNAALSLAYHRSPAASPHLVRALGHPDRKTRHLAALALALGADGRAASALATTWKYNLGEVADAAREGLEAIAGREFAEVSSFEGWFSAHRRGLGKQIKLAIAPEEKAWKERALSAHRARRLGSLPVRERVRFWVWRCDVYDLPFSERLVISDPFRRLISLGADAVGALVVDLNRGADAERCIAASALGEIGGRPAADALRAALRRETSARVRMNIEAAIQSLGS